MASEAQRAARALMERRVERFESRHGMAESQARLADTLSRARLEGRVVFTPEWRDADGKVLLDAGFTPPKRVGMVLKTLSVTLTLLILATAWAQLSVDAGPSSRWLLTLSTVIAMLIMPWVFVAMGSSRLAEEARIVRAIKAALMDEEERLPPMKKWDEE
jgi:hypothetical protein